MMKFVFAGAALVMTHASLALAQPAPLNDDRSVSVSELQQRHAERFTRLDANKDGQLSQQEMQADRRGPGMRGPGGRFRMHARGPGGAGGPGPLFRGADADRDGVVTQQEFTAEGLKRFQQLDANRDGRIVAEEARAGRGRMAGRMGERRFARLDADRDGAVSRAEFDRPFAERIGRLDANRDGKVTGEERRSARPAERR